MHIDNYSLKSSTHIIFGDMSDRPKAKGLKEHRMGNWRGGTNSEAFGVGKYKTSPVFTVSMIEPNWIHTTVSDATVQTLDIQLAWGDTSESVVTQTGNPVQFSIICSP